MAWRCVVGSDLGILLVAEFDDTIREKFARVLQVDLRPHRRMALGVG